MTSIAVSKNIMSFCKTATVFAFNLKVIKPVRAVLLVTRRLYTSLL